MPWSLAQSTPNYVVPLQFISCPVRSSQLTHFRSPYLNPLISILFYSIAMTNNGR